MSMAICFCIAHSQSGVTYDEPSGRLGDQLLMFAKAKFFAYRYNLPLYYRQFDYFDQLAMHDRLPHYDGVRGKYKEILCKDMSAGAPINTNGIMYKIHYDFKFSDWDMRPGYEIMSWPGFLSDKNFLKELKKDIALRAGGMTISLPTDKITVAVHIRQGGGVDAPILSQQIYKKYIDQEHPFKFPPLQYFVDQIKRLSEMLGNQPLYVHIYTDSRNPVATMDVVKKEVGKANITFNCRRQNNAPQINVLEDMFAMAQYDCLIRSASNYARISQLIGDHKIVIYPKAMRWEGPRLIVTDVGTYIRE